MAQQPIFSTRYGLQTPRGENLQATEILCEGGLDQTQSVLETRPGFASALLNYEVALTGGYRRINGYSKYSTTAVTGIGSVLGVALQPVQGRVVAARENADTSHYDLYYSTGTTWTLINGAGALNYSSGMIVNSCLYNWTGTYILTFTDGVNPAYKWDGTTFTILNAAGSAANPQFCCEFAGYLFVAGYSSNSGAVKISAPLNDADWATLDGAAEIVIGDTITWLASWRQQLIIFCRNSIYRIVGNSTSTTSATPFTVQRITNRIGCPEGRTVKELDGDLVFLAQDGIRTISGTIKIGDAEIGSISRQIQSIISGINPTTTLCHASVIRKKTQYRLFYNTSAIPDTAAQGVIGGIRRFRDGHEDWEWGQLIGIRPSCTTDGYFFTNNQEYIIHGGYDGFVYRQEQGGQFNDAAIPDVYTTVPLEFGDRGVRKSLHRATLYITTEGTSTTQAINLNVIYNLGDTLTSQPAPYTLSSSGASINTVYDGSGVTYDTTGIVYDIQGTPLYRQLIQGSGFLAQLQFTGINATNPFTIQGMLIEYFPSGRR